MRVSDRGRLDTLLSGLAAHNKVYLNLSNQLSSGVKVSNPGDDEKYSLIVSNENKLADIELFSKRINYLRGYFEFVEENLSQANSVLIRAKEIATQASNETYSPEARERLSHEIFQLRDHLVQLANATYQGRFIWAGTDDDDPPFDAQAYTVPASGPASVRYVFDAEPGTNETRSVQISPDFSVEIAGSGFDVFARAIGSLERLGRALAGYSTNPPTGLPNGTGSAYSFPADYQNQTNAIRQALDMIEEARAEDIANQRTLVGSRMTRLNIASEILRLDKSSAEEFLAKHRDTDIAEVSSKISLVETHLQATYLVIARVSNLNLLDYL
ncbi:MAG: flagellin [Deltaproteobacteria bacterium]|nr:flagellin [Deltaproteobacteria bacterium]MCX7952875.1 flagellin [Deltaproteobacteria bacterium]